MYKYGDSRNKSEQIGTSRNKSNKTEFVEQPEVGRKLVPVSQMRWHITHQKRQKSEDMGKETEQSGTLFSAKADLPKDKITDELQSDTGDKVLNAFTGFIDMNLRIVRNLTWVVAGVGVIIIIRRTYAFRWFRSVTDIPPEYIKRNVWLRGKVLEVREDHSLGIEHIPLFQRMQFWKQPSTLGDNSSLLPVNIAGVELRDGSFRWLSENVKQSEVKFCPLRVNRYNYLDCLVHKRRNWFSNTSINETLVREGIAVTKHVKGLRDNPQYNKLLPKLLKAEVRAEKKGAGIWTKPSTWERFKAMFLWWRTE